MEVISLGNERYYLTPQGKLPSVTTILSATADRAFLDAWRTRVGDEAADNIRDVSANRGKAVHAALEAILDGEIVEEGEDIAPFLFSARKALQSVSGPYVIEYPVWHSLGYAGTADLVCKFQGERFLVDWKTTEKWKSVKWIGDHLLQVTAYLKAYQERTDEHIDGVAVVYLQPNKEPQIFTMYEKSIERAWIKFQERLDEWNSIEHEPEGIEELGTPS